MPANDQRWPRVAQVARGLRASRANAPAQTEQIARISRAFSLTLTEVQGDAHHPEARRVTEGPPRGDSLGVSLLIMTKSGVYTQALPEAGELTLGRGEDCDVRVDDRKVSRKHAILRLGAKFEIVDLGSFNGTLVRGHRLQPQEPTEIDVGDMITLGTAVLVLQSAPMHDPPARVWSQAAFEERAEAERQRALRTGTSFAIVQVRLESAATADPSRSTSSLGADVAENVARVEKLEAALRASLRTNDVIGSYAVGVYEILICETAPDVAHRLALQLASRLNVDGFNAELGVACYPRDGLTHEALQERAEAALSDPNDVPPASERIDGGFMKEMEQVIDRISAGMINVLILGETGVGKEVLARALHERSPRRDAPLLCLNCAALSEPLLESELFGHERGAFTGATQAKPGLLESAQGGTVLLDEVGEMPLALQAKLLRVLEQREVLRIGSVRPRPIDVRFVSATNRDLEDEIDLGRFRRDLFFRLNGISVTIPPLRERPNEIEWLARAFVVHVCEQAKRAEVPTIAEPVMALLKRYEWPGNIRELKNLMDRAVLLCAGSVITLEHLPTEKMSLSVMRSARLFEAEALTGRRAAYGERATPEPALRAPPLPAQLNDDPSAEDERQAIIVALDRCAGNQTQAAKLLGLSRRTLVSRLGQHGIPRPRKKP